MGLDNFLLILDETLTSILGEWDIYSTTIATFVFVLFAWRVFTSRDPDTHPMLLARQAQPSSIRQAHESPVYRSQSTPHGMDLNAGLNIKDEGVSKWARGRTGDLRDVWRKIVSGAVDKDGKATGEVGTISTVSGSTIVQHRLDHIAQQINVIGKYIADQKGARIAIYLPNSIELITAIFACSFYNSTPILIPYTTEPSDIASFLKSANADVLVAPAGTVNLIEITERYRALRNLIWVLNPGNEHVDFSSSSIESLTVAIWQNLLDQNADITAELPASSDVAPPPNLVAFWGDAPVAYTHANLAAAISAQINVIPISQRVSPSDLVFPADALSTIYTLVVTLAACYCSASLVLNSISGPHADLISATQHVSPTIIIATPDSLKAVLQSSLPKIRNSLAKSVHWLQSRSLRQDGVMPSNNIITSINSRARQSLGSVAGKLRLIFTAEQVGLTDASLSSSDLSDLRVFTGARIGYALTASKIAGAISQTAIYDYRVDDVVGHRPHFGSPLSSVEIYFKDTKDKRSTDQMSIGEICVRGPAVVNGHARLGVDGMMREDMTLAYA